jgi:phage tail sheath gpL-like
MPVSFSNIPANWRQPLYWVEIDPSMAGLPINRLPAMLVGVMLSAGKAAVNVPLPIASQTQADNAFGQGSQLSNMVKAFLRNNVSQELWCLPVAEGSTASTGQIVVSSAPTAAGTLHLYVGGTHVPVPIGASDTTAVVATSIGAALDADGTLPVVKGTVSGSTVPIHAKWKGTTGDDIQLSTNYYGAVGGELTPTGLALTITQLSGGAGDPTWTTALSNLGETEVEYVCIPFTDSTSLNAWTGEFDFSDSGRWGWMRQHFGHLFSCKRGDLAGLLTFAESYNSAQLSVMGVETTSPSPVYEWAAAYTAKAARALSNDPARPLQTLLLDGILSAPGQDRFVLSELNTLATGGIATQRTPQAGTPMIARETTTATVNLYGFSDDAYELVTTLATLAKLLRNQRQAITSKFPRHKLADDGTRFGAGQAIVTPKTIKAELVAQYRIDEFNGLVENAQQFIDNLIVERDSSDPNRVNVLYPPDLVNQLRVFAVLAQFRLQYDRGLDVGLATATGA